VIFIRMLSFFGSPNQRGARLLSSAPTPKRPRPHIDDFRVGGAELNDLDGLVEVPRSRSNTVARHSCNIFVEIAAE